MKNFKDFNEFLGFVREDEAGTWNEIQKLRKEFEGSYERLAANLSIDSAKSFKIIFSVLDYLDGVMAFDKVDLGHGIGHLIRDYSHAILLAKEVEMDPKQACIGIIAGALHDVGCTVIKRYTESKRAVRHAEAGGILIYRIMKNLQFSQDEALFVFYAIAAHTHYLKSSTVVCSDGIVREINPYLDIDKNGEPIMSIWLTRWVDRLDTNGPCFVGRHFVTQIEEHEDFGRDGYYIVKFSEHMRPLLRSDEEVRSDSTGKTMREHLSMFANSQNEDSPYGRFDYSGMVVRRDAYKARLFRIIDSFDHPVKLSHNEEILLLSEWDKWLVENVEPIEKAKDGVKKLHEMFLTLSQETKEAWFSAMKTTLKEYDEWAKKMKDDLSKFSGVKMLELPILGNVKSRLDRKTK